MYSSYVQVLLEAGCVKYIFRFCWRLVVYSIYVQVLLEAGCV